MLISSLPVVCTTRLISRTTLRACLGAPRDRILSALLGLEILERDHASVHKSGYAIRNLDRRRNIGIIKRVVERIAKEGEAAMMMKPGNSKPKSKAAAPIRSVSVVWIIGGAVGRIAAFRVNPGLGRATSHFPGRLGRRRPPGQPNCVRRHA